MKQDSDMNTNGPDRRNQNNTPKEETPQVSPIESEVDYWAKKWQKSYEENQSLRDQLEHERQVVRNCHTGLSEREDEIRKLRDHLAAKEKEVIELKTEKGVSLYQAAKKWVEDESVSITAQELKDFNSDRYIPQTEVDPKCTQQQLRKKLREVNEELQQRDETIKELKEALRELYEYDGMSRYEKDQQHHRIHEAIRDKARKLISSASEEDPTDGS